MAWWFVVWAGCGTGGAPQVVSIDLAPASPTVLDPLTATVIATDPDDDPIMLSFRWFVDGDPVPEHTAAQLPAGVAIRGQQVEVEVVPSDASEAGDPARSDAVTVVNHPPSATGASITPDPLTSADVASCTLVGFSDPDGDAPASTVAWTVDGVADATGPDAGPFAQGQTVSCTATPSDGLASGAPVTAPTLTVGNGAPVGADGHVLPVDAVLGRDDLVCARTVDGTDPDGDVVIHGLQWLADGELWRGETTTTDAPGDTIPAFVTPRALTWTCQIVATDTHEATTITDIVATPEVTGTNVLILLADDLGNDKVGAYAEHPSPPPTPNIDALASEGVLFRNFYATHGCSPTRASMITGRHTKRYGIGGIIDPEIDIYALPEAELSLPEMLDHAPVFPYETSLVGKWHLASYVSGAGSSHPAVEGFDWHAGSMENLGQARLLYAPLDYFRWEKNTNGILSESLTYATVDTLRDALDRVEAMAEPWLLWVAFNAPHVPLHAPPYDPRLTLSVDNQSTDVEVVNAMIESLDLAIGDLIGGIDPAVLDRTTIVFVGDNGTSLYGTEPPWDPDRAKSSIYEAGINVPLIVSGPLVTAPGTESTALVSAVDLYSTVAAIAGVDVVEVDQLEGVAVRDSVNFLPYLATPDRPSRRDWVYSDKHLPNGPPPYTHDRRTVFDGRYKLHHHTTPTNDYYEFYDLDGLSIEGPDLLTGPLDAAQQAAYDRLFAQLQTLDADLMYEY